MSNLIGLLQLHHFARADNLAMSPNDPKRYRLSWFDPEAKLTWTLESRSKGLRLVGWGYRRGLWTQLRCLTNHEWRERYPNGPRLVRGVPRG